MKRILLGAIGISIALCQSEVLAKVPPQENNPTQTQAKLVKVQPAVNRTLVERLILTGTLQPENQAKVLSTTEGKISKLLVREGDRVAADQIVAMISPLVREDIIISARLMVERKKDQLNKQPDNEALKRELEQAQQDYQFAFQQYKEIPVTAPIAGLVSKRWVDLGDMVTAKATLFEIQSDERIRVDLAVSELDLGKLYVGQTANIKADACPEKSFKGVVQRIYPQIDPQTRNGMVEVSLEEPCPNLRTGMFVRVTFVARKLENALAIPVAAIIERPKNKTCFIVNDNKAKEVILQTGLEADGWVEIRSGLKSGDRVIIEGQGQLKPDMPVKIAPEVKKMK